MNFSIELVVDEQSNVIRLYSTSGRYWAYEPGKVPEEVANLVRECIRHQVAQCNKSLEMLDLESINE